MVIRIKALACLVVVGITCTAFAQDRATVSSYRTDAAPTIDGEIDGDEWDAAGPWILVNQDAPNAFTEADLIEEDPFGGDEDISFRFKTMWQEDTANFFIVYEVFDDIAMEELTANPWEVDQIETFFDGTNLEGDDDPVSFHWWESDETYGKFGVSRFNTFEGNVGRVTDDENLWDEGFGGIPALAATVELETNADYRIEMAVSLIPMLDDEVHFPYADTPTEEAQQIVEDSTTIKFTAAVSDDDNFMEDGSERSSVITYYREIDGEPVSWDVSSGFATMEFTGEFDGVIVEPVAGDCNNDGVLNADDLSCQTADMLGDTLQTLGILAGDFDGNGAVEFPDFLTLSGNFNKEGNYTDGDTDGSGVIDFTDFLTLSGNFGKSFSAAAAVPEPGTNVLAGLAAVMLFALRRRKNG